MQESAAQATPADISQTCGFPVSRAGGGIFAATAIFLLALAMHLPWLGLSPIAGTEGHRILPAHAMVQTGWWSVPTLFGRPYLAKPPLHYWLIALSEKIFGEANVFVWRLPSAIAGAALCAVAYWFALRWFGQVAGLISGFCAIGLITIWGQAHVADIDATNTLAATITAFCGIELFVARPTRAAAWVLTAGAALAATFLTKGPGALPIIVGVWLWGLIAASETSRRATPIATATATLPAEGPTTLAYQRPTSAKRRSERLRLCLSPRFWLPWVMMIVVFGIWGLAAVHGLHARGLTVDWAGVREGTDRLRGHTVLSFGKSLIGLPSQLFLFATPVSLALPFYFHPEVREELQGVPGQIAKALVYSVLLSWGVCVLSAMENPRYGYPTLIPLCPLAGAVAVAAAQRKRGRELLEFAAASSAILFAVGSLVLTIMGWKTMWAKPLLVGTLFVELIVLVWTIRLLRYGWQGAWGLALLAVLTIIPFSVHEQLTRTATSGISSAALLRSILGENGVVAVAGAVDNRPEAFYYAGVRPHYFKSPFLPSRVEPGTWIMLDQDEYKRWNTTPGVKLEQDRFLCQWGPTTYRIAWYASR
jgi:hypothetical protein